MLHSVANIAAIIAKKLTDSIIDLFIKCHNGEGN
jgi:hypothetical protein